MAEHVKFRVGPTFENGLDEHCRHEDFLEKINAPHILCKVLSYFKMHGLLLVWRE